MYETTDGSTNPNFKYEKVKKLKQYTTILIVSISTKLTMTSSSSYLNTFFDAFIAPKIRALHLFTFNNSVNNPDIRYLDETEKRKAMGELLSTLVLYQDTNCQWISDKDDAILTELTRLLHDVMTLPIIDTPLGGRRSLFYDLVQLQDLLNILSTELHCDDITYFIKEMMKCTPHSAIQYELLLKTGQFKVYYNRLTHLATQLERSEFDGGQPEYDVKDAIMSAYSKLMAVKTDEEIVEIPDDRDEFQSLWRRKAFDNQHLLYPLQKMYRNMPYTDDWLYAHRDQLKYMNGDAYWRKSPAYTQIEASVRFAFYNYPNVIANDEFDFMRRPNDATPDRVWNLETPPICPYVAPNQTLKTYYNSIVADFCECIERNNAGRTGAHLAHIYTQASKIRVMSEWMRGGIDGVKIDEFIPLASLEPVANPVANPVDNPDMSNHPTALYLSLIDCFAYAVCMKEDVVKTTNTLKMMTSIVA